MRRGFKDHSFTVPIQEPHSSAAIAHVDFNFILLLPTEEVLAIQIRQWLDAATLHDVERTRAVIAPHAGYRYCGHVMAHAYKHISPTHV
jgi:predicted class III extradiol MEMO1 family dioxygenase